MNKRMNTFYIQSRVFLTNHPDESYPSKYFAAKEYRSLGPNIGHRSQVVSTTDQRLRTISHMWSVSDDLLLKSGQDDYCAKSATQPMHRDCWHYLLNKISHSVNANVISTNTSKQIVHPDLTVGSTFLTVKTESLTISRGVGFDSLKQLVCNNHGIWVKKNTHLLQI